MEIILKTNNISKRYGTTLALDDVSMTINRGDIYGFIGENGAGKSTIIRIISGLANPTSGTYQLDSSVTTQKGKLAAVVETPAIHQTLSAYQNLSIQCDLLGIVNNKDLVIKEILTLVGLDYLIGKKKTARNFSLGMKQRLGIAMALVNDPEFIILDEPMNGLDPVGIVQMRNLILRLNKDHGITFLISSHILTELDRVATKYGFISKGKLLQEITTKELHAKASGYVELTVNKTDNQVIGNVLKNIKYDIVDGNIINVYGIEDPSAIVKQLVMNDVIVSSVKQVTKGIEEYYLEIIGGNK